MLRTLAKKCGKSALLGVAFAIIAFAVLITGLRIFSTFIDKNRTFIINWASSTLHLPVKITKISSSWNGFEPSITFSQMVILNRKHQPMMAVKRLTISISPVRSLLAWRLMPDAVIINGAQLSVSHKALQSLMQSEVNQSLSLADVLWWLAQQTKVTVKNVDLLWQTQGRVIPYSNIHFAVTNNNNVHQLKGSFLLKQTIPTAVHFRMDVQKIDLKNQQFQANIYLQAKHVALAQWLPHRWVKGGVASGQLWLLWREGRLQRVQGELNASHIKIADAPLLYKKISGNFIWDTQPTGWRFGLVDMQLQRGNSAWPKTNMTLDVTRPRVGGSHYLFTSNFVRLQDISKVLAQLPILSTKMKSWLKNLRPHANLHDLSVQYNRMKNRPDTFSLSTDYSHFSNEAYANIPGVNNVFGHISLNQKSGELITRSPNVQLFLPKLYSHPLKLGKTHMQLTWHNTGDDFAVIVKKFHCKGVDADFGGSARVDKKALLPIRMDVMAHWRITRANVLARYMPDRVVDKPLMQWLRVAIKSGEIRRGNARIDGGFNTLQLLAKLQNMRIQFAPQWPDLNDLSGIIAMNAKRMSLVVDRGNVAGIPLAGTKLLITHAKQPMLSITGKSIVPVNVALNALRQMPFAKQLNKQKLSGEGKLFLRYDVIFPPKHPEKWQGKGVLSAVNASVFSKKNKIGLTAINGNVRFVNHNLFSNKIRVRLLNHPFHFELKSTGRHKIAGINVRASGKVNITSLKKHWHNPLWRFVNGGATVHAALAFNNGALHKLVLTSALRGISATKLPPPFTKFMDVPTPSGLTIDFTNNSGLKLSAHYADRLATALQFKSVRNQLQFMRGTIQIGSAHAAVSSLPGLVVKGRLERVSFSQWQPLFAAMANEKYKSDSNKHFRRATLTIQHFTIAKQTASPLHVAIIAHPSVLQLQLKSPIVQGEVQLPLESHEPWKARLQKLMITKTAGAKTISATNPKNIPPLDITINHFTYGKKTLGGLRLVTMPTQTGMAIQACNLKSPIYHLELSGWWRNVSHKQHTAILGRFSSGNLGQLLSQWGYKKILNKSTANSQFTMQWPGSPWQMQAATLTGGLNFQLNKGAILKIDNDTQSDLSVARMLNILSLQSLSHWLKLDFSHAIQKGFAFKHIGGNVDFSKGIAQTKRIALVSSVADVNLSGSANFQRKNYDLRLRVKPKLTASLPVLATLAGGPVAGAVTWAMSKVAGDSLSDAMGAEYQVTGPWAAPKVVKLNKKSRPLAPVEQRIVNRGARAHSG